MLGTSTWFRAHDNANGFSIGSISRQEKKRSQVPSTTATDEAVYAEYGHNPSGSAIPVDPQRGLNADCIVDQSQRKFYSAYGPPSSPGVRNEYIHIWDRPLPQPTATMRKYPQAIWFPWGKIKNASFRLVWSFQRAENSLEVPVKLRSMETTRGALAPKIPVFCPDSRMNHWHRACLCMKLNARHAADKRTTIQFFQEFLRKMMVHVFANQFARNVNESMHAGAVAKIYETRWIP